VSFELATVASAGAQLRVEVAHDALALLDAVRSKDADECAFRCTLIASHAEQLGDQALAAAAHAFIGILVSPSQRPGELARALERVVAAAAIASPGTD
jgi:hypothetical protein